MTNLVDDLRKAAKTVMFHEETLWWKAADEIERLEKGNEDVARLKDEGYFRVAPSVIQEGIEECGNIIVAELVERLRSAYGCGLSVKEYQLLAKEAADALEQMQKEWKRDQAQLEDTALSCVKLRRRAEKAEAELQATVNEQHRDMALVNTKLTDANQRAEKAEAEVERLKALLPDTDLEAQGWRKS